MNEDRGFIKTIFLTGFIASIVITPLFFIYGSYSGFQKYRNFYEGDVYIYNSIKCASKYSDATIIKLTETNPLTESFANFDVSKLGCNDNKSFFTNLSEIQRFRKGELEKPVYGEYYGESWLGLILGTGLEYAVPSFALINFFSFCLVLFCISSRALYLSLSFFARWIFRK